MSAVQATPSGCRIRVRVQPRAAHTGVVGLHGDAVRIRVAAPPVDGAANEALVRFLAERLEVPRRAVLLAHGTGSRDKIVDVTGLAPDRASRLLGL